MKTTALRALTGSFLALTTFALLAVAQQQMPRTTKEDIKGAATVTTEKLSGTVVLVDGGNLVVRMSTGEIRTFTPPPGATAMIDGKATTLSELKPGTRLHATYTTTTTPITERTTTIGTGKVWFVSGNTVIITLPNNENRMYKVDGNYRFNVEGKKASVFELKKGMMISAEKIVESPRTEIAKNSVVTGEAPPPPKTVASAPPPPPRSEPAPEPVRRAEPTPAPPPPTPAPVEAAALPAKLPKTASPLPLIGFAGLLFTGASLTLRRLRRM